MKKNSICKIIVSGLLTAVPLMGMAQQVCGNKPWSVRMAESEGALSRILAIGFSDPFEVGLLSWPGTSSYAGCI